MLPFLPSGKEPKLRAAGRTHAGRRRKLNEDYVLLKPQHGLFVVADGVGGKNAGEVASCMASLSMRNFFEATESESWPDSYRVLLDLTLSEPAKRLSAAVRKANADVWEIASSRKKQKNMNSTIVAAYVEHGSMMLQLAHVGDSRCYRVRDQSIEQLTRDHSLRNEARLQTPNISDRQPQRIPKNVITRALGRRDGVEIDIRSQPVLAGDVFLLCSDGVNRMLPDERILEALLVSDDPKEAADLLITIGNDAGGIDNITALVIQFAS